MAVAPNLDTPPRRPEHFLVEALRSRRERNPSYTVSAFARDLGVSISLLARVIAGTRPMTLKFALQACEALDLPETDRRTVLVSVLHHSSSSAKISKKLRARLETLAQGHDSTAPAFTTVELERFRAMADWQHLAILNWVKLDHPDHKPARIARDLGIPVGEARLAVERLITLDLLSEAADGRLARTGQSFYVRTQRSEAAVRQFHGQMITKASEELRKTSDADFARRLINGITFTCGPEHIERIKDKIDRFQDEILALVGNGARDSVYQMNVQFFPLTPGVSE